MGRWKEVALSIAVVCATAAPSLAEGPAAQADATNGHARVSIGASDGDRVRTGKSMEVAAGETVEGDAVVIGGDLHVRGKVLGDAVAVGGTVYLHEGASVGKEAVAVGGRVVRETGASVEGGRSQIDIPCLRGWIRELVESGAVHIDVDAKKKASAPDDSDDESDDDDDWM